MAAITAAAVMALREKTGLPMMECKKALTECGGDTDQAVEWLRKQGVKTQAMRADRETSMGRLAVYTDLEKGVGRLSNSSVRVHRSQVVLISKIS